MNEKNINNEIKFIEGKRIYLRPISKDDIPYFLKWFNDLEVRQFFTSGAYLPITQESEEEWYKKMSKEDDRNIILSVVAGKKLIGVIGIYHIDWKDRGGTSSTTIGDKKYWGKGYGTEAKMILLNYAFNTLNLRKIVCDILSFNERSLKCQKKCGYVEIGKQKEHVFVNGKYEDIILLEVFKKDWLKIWEKDKKKYMK